MAGGRHREGGGTQGGRLVEDPHGRRQGRSVAEQTSGAAKC